MCASPTLISSRSQPLGCQSTVLEGRSSSCVSFFLHAPRAVPLGRLQSRTRRRRARHRRSPTLSPGEESPLARRMRVFSSSITSPLSGGLPDDGFGQSEPGLAIPFGGGRRISNKASRKRPALTLRALWRHLRGRMKSPARRPPARTWFGREIGSRSSRETRPKSCRPRGCTKRSRAYAGAARRLAWDKVHFPDAHVLVFEP